MSFVADMRDRVASLKGSTIVRASVVEMALVEQGTHGLPIFRNAAAPFIQAIEVELALADGRFAVFSNWQNDDGFPICMEILSSSVIKPHWDDVTRYEEPSIFRLASDLNMPVGLVTGIETELDQNGAIVAVVLAFEGNEVVLRAGEVNELTNNVITLDDMGGSILIFLSPNDRSRTEFNKPIELS